MTEFDHTTVLLNEAVDGLNIKNNGVYVDCTLGGGGHTRLILSELSSDGQLFSFDQDQTAIDYNQRIIEEKHLHNLNLIKDNFRNIKIDLEQRNITKVDGILYDLGVSSPQFDDGARGFSYRFDAPLDMRMDQTQSLTAKTIVNEWDFSELVRIFYRYGEEKFSKQIARKIEQARSEQPINTTFELVDLIKAGIPAAARRSGGHPAKKVFQALRIAVNDELGALEDSIEQAFKLLDHGGRISVITFQSLEDRLIKTMFREKTQLPDLPHGLPVIPDNLKPQFKLIQKKPIIPTQVEQDKNHRSHSAKLRIIERI